MIALRLFALADASRQIDVRVLGAREEITLGRDAAADWPLDDPDRALSRLHLKVGVRDGVVSVTDISTNGVTSANRGERLPRDQTVQVQPGERLELGPYALLIERSDHVVAPEPIASRAAPNPFTPMGEIDEAPEMRRPVDPFVSGLAPDPLALDRPSNDGLTGDLGLGSVGRGAHARASSGLPDGDVWNRREEPRAGGWEATPTRAEPTIGAARVWTDPVAEDVDERSFGFDAPFRQPILRTPDVAASDLAIPSDWDVAPAGPAGPAQTSVSPFDAPATERRPPKPSRDQAASAEPPPPPPPPAPAPVQPQPEPPIVPASPEPAPPSACTTGLFEAFCAGAKLDPSSLAGEDQAAMMQRLGAVYRHMVLGLSDVLGERTALKNEYRMVRTTIQADENNPFKWAPPQKVATELLRSASDGFLDGPTAVAESYQDVKKHLLCMLAGLRAALSSSLDTLSPGRIEEAIKDQSFVLKPRASVAWAEYVKVYGQFRKEAEDSADSPVNREFRAAYEKQLDELDRIAPR